MRTRSWLPVLVLLPSASASAIYQVDGAAAQRMEAGKAQVLSIMSDAGASKSCWDGALEVLKSGCRSMDDVQRSRLAVRFTNCHLAKSGLATYECDPHMDVQACTKPMVDSPSGLAYSTYTLFYTHAESMCFYLQSEAFQAATEAAVTRLHQGAEQAAADLATLSSSQAAAFGAARSQVEGLSAQSAAALAELHREATELGAKQHSLLSGLDRLLGVQSAVLGEFLDLKTLLFYTCAVLLALALTSTPRSAAARLPIFVLLTTNAILEKCIAAHLSTGAAGPDTASLHGYVWASRRATSALALAALVHALVAHQDVGKLTLAVLDELRTVQRESSENLSSKLERLEREAARAAHDASVARSRELSRSIAHGALFRARHLSPAARARSSLSPPVGRRHLSPASTGRGPSLLAADANLAKGDAAKGAPLPTARPDESSPTGPSAASLEPELRPSRSPPRVPMSRSSSGDSAPPPPAASPPPVVASGGGASSAVALSDVDLSSVQLKPTPVPKAKAARRASVSSSEASIATPTRRSVRIASRSTARRSIDG